MRKLLIPGAGIYQVPLIRKAKEMGLFTVVASIPGNWPGFRLADKVCEVDTTDCEGMLKAAREEKIDGIVTTGTDVAVRAIGYVCDVLGLHGISAEAAERLTDKAKMKTAFRGIVSTGDFRVVRTEEEAMQAAGLLGYPVMVKAVDVSGSRGITKVERKEDLAAAVLSAKSVSCKDYFVVEEAVDGTEIGLDAFVENGKTAAFFPHEKYVRRIGGTTIPAGHSFPYRGSKETEAALRRELDAIVQASGMDNCAVNCDIMVKKDGTVSVIEAGGRCGATCIPELIGIWSGIDYYRQMILCALGEETDFRTVSQVPCSARLLMSEKGGIVSAIDYTRLLEIKEKNEAEILLDIREGDTVHSAHNGTDRFGHVIMKTDSEELIDNVCEEIINTVALKPETV